MSLVKFPSEKFNILNPVEFISGPTRSAGYNLKESKNSVIHSYFYHIPRLWNSLPLFDLSQTLQTIKFKLRNYFWNHFVDRGLIYLVDFIT